MGAPAAVATAGAGPAVATADASPAAVQAGSGLTTTLGLGEPIVGTDISLLGGQQYHQNNQRNFWWNAVAGRWDGILPTGSPPADSASRWWMWHDIGGTPTPIGLVETVRSATPDAYWDVSTSTLYVFFARGNTGISKFRRYVYDAAADRYVEVSRSGGVNAPEMLRGGKRVTIVKSPNGALWAGVNFDNKLLVSRSTDGGDTWPEPAVIKNTSLAGEGHWVLLQVNGRTHVGFAATEDGAAADAKVHFLHLDQDEADWRNPSRWTDETSQLPGWEGDERADDELSAIAFENRVFVAIETEPRGKARSQQAPQLLVYERGASGGWTKHVIQRYTPSSSNDAKRPVITVDAASRNLVVSGGTWQFTHADVWYAPIDALSGLDEQWTKLRVFQVDDPTTQNIYTTRMPLPRFPVTAESNLPILIDDRGDAMQMWRQVLRSTGSGGNRPPVVQPIEDVVVGDGDTAVVNVGVSDPDGDALTVSVDGLPGFASFDPATRRITVAPAPGDAGTYGPVTVSVTDGELSDSTTFQITVLAPGESATSLRSASSHAITNVSASVLRIDRPAAVEPGDLLLAQIRYRGATANLTVPPGWAEVATLTRKQANHSVYYKVAGAAEPASYDFNQNVAEGRIAGAIGAYAGVDSVAPIHTWAASSGDTATLVAPDAVSSVENALVVRLWGWRGSSATEPDVGFNVPPTGIAQRWSEQVGHVNTDRNRVLAGDHVAASPGPVGAATAAGSIHTGENRRSAFTIILNPSS